MKRRIVLGNMWIKWAALGMILLKRGTSGWRILRSAGDYRHRICVMSNWQTLSSRWELWDSHVHPWDPVQLVECLIRSEQALFFEACVKVTVTAGLSWSVSQKDWISSGDHLDPSSWERGTFPYIRCLPQTPAACLERKVKFIPRQQSYSEKRHREPPFWATFLTGK